jgi:N-methylhydantoinase A/oxoprolinase/acetone carboxylase beta subunit
MNTHKIFERRTGVVSQVYKTTAVIDGHAGSRRTTPTQFIWRDFSGTEADVGRPVEFKYQWSSTTGVGRRYAVDVRFIDSHGVENGGDFREKDL